MTIVISLIADGAVLKYQTPRHWCIEAFASVERASARARQLAPAGAIITIKALDVDLEWRTENVMI